MASTRTRRVLISLAAAAVAASAAAFVLTRPDTAAAVAAPPVTTPVERTTLVAELRLVGTLAYGDPEPLPAEVVEAFARRGLDHPRVFGSIVHGTETPSSDVDLLVPLVPGPHFRLVDLYDLERELERLLTFDVDVVDETHLAPASFRDRVRREAVPV